MSLIEVKVPDIGDFTDVPVIDLFVKPGDNVKPEDPLVTLESDKATMDVPSPSGGVVRLLWDLNALGTATMMIILSLFVAAVSLALIVREIRAPILGWLGLPIAAVLAVGGAAGFYNSSHEAFWYGLNYVALLSFAAFILGVSVQGLLSAAGETRVLRTPPRPIPST